MLVQRRDIKIVSYAQPVSFAAHSALFKKKGYYQEDLLRRDKSWFLCASLFF